MRARDYGSSLADKTEFGEQMKRMSIGNDTAEKADVWRRLSFYFTGIFRQSYVIGCDMAAVYTGICYGDTVFITVNQRSSQICQ